MEKNFILKNIVSIRRKHGFSQENLAYDLGMSHSGYALIESGKRKLSFELLLQIANVFKMNIIDIITFPDIYVKSISEKQKTHKISVELEISDEEFQALNISDKLKH
jgi:transcriptional regulator with XRE-family HTH domain